MSEGQEHTLEFLLAFDGHVHRYSQGYFTKFEVRKVAPTAERPHGLRYSFTLHAPEGVRLMGFDNAHAVAPVGARFTKRRPEADHWHRTGDDPGRPYAFTDAATLLFDFFAEVERILIARDVPLDVVTIEEANPRSTP